jgi:uncharacterized protein YjbI with pentapeptide repeats
MSWSRRNAPETKFTDAILRDIDVSNCKDLNTSQFAGADLTGAKLPESIASFEMLKTLEGAASQAKTLFISLLAACAYTWLTVGSTRDLSLLSNPTTSPLAVL